MCLVGLKLRKVPRCSVRGFVTEKMTVPELLKASLPFLSSPSMHSLKSLQAVPSSPPMMLLRTGQWGELQQELRLETVPAAAGTVAEGEMSPGQQMLVKAVRLGLADATGDWCSPSPPAASLMAPDCTSHGVTGLPEVLAAKKAYFTHNKPGAEGLFYSLETFTVDPASSMVAFTYNCLIPGLEGRCEDIDATESRIISQ